MKSVYLFVLLSTIYSHMIYSQQISIKDSWVRPAAKGANTALYFIASNNSNTADTLIGAESNFAEIVEIHETYKKENDMIGMRAVNYVLFPPKSELKFKPGGFHIMLINVNKNLKVGDVVDVVLHFKHSKNIKLKVPVKESSAHMGH